MRKILPKFASLTHEIVADFSRCRHAAHRTLRFLLQRFRCETRKTSAQLQCKSAPCCAPKKSRTQRRDCVNFPLENGRTRCTFAARSTLTAFAALCVCCAFLACCAFRALRLLRFLHQNFGRRRCENILASQNSCVEFLARAMPKTHTSNVEHAQDFAKICINDARNC